MRVRCGKAASNIEGGRFVHGVFLVSDEWAAHKDRCREQQMKNAKVQSLRYQVEKWLTPTMPVHVTAFGRTPSGRGRYVCVATWQLAGSRALFFFRHDDGCWHVWPPLANDTPQLRVRRTGTHGG
jgi:hypothetical protein